MYDKQRACELIVRRVNLYGRVTCLQMALAADDKKFLYEDACQTVLMNIWYDKVDPVRERPVLAVNFLTLGISQIFISIYEKYNLTSARITSATQTYTSMHSKRQLKKTGIDYTNDYGKNETVFRHFLHFHNRPIVKYFYTCFGYALFLLCFSYYMLYAFDPLSNGTLRIHWTEILTIITVTTMLVEEVRQFFFQDNKSLIGKIYAYFDLRNRASNLCLVLPAYVLFYIGLVLRFTRTDPDDFESARIVMAYDLELWFIRSVLFIEIASQLGPKLAMIRKMDFFRNVVYPAYYFVLGRFDDELSQLDDKPNDSGSIATQVMFAFHMLFVNILLINLLIALFSFTINDIQAQARYIWAYARCDIIRNYYARPALFPPFTIIISFAQLCRWCWLKCCRNHSFDETDDDESSQYFAMIPMNDDTDRIWSDFERYSTNDYIRKLLDTQTDSATNAMTADIVSKSLSSNTDESNWVKHDVNQLKEVPTHTHADMSNKLTSMGQTVNDFQSQFKQMDNRFDNIRTEMKEVKDLLNSLMAAMNHAKMGN
ncbi:unnamed protein product [Rotaria sordida]|uniref:TRPM-like domain-containing protein n=1 Tax=Rotaria sordida TaxID=392033 RepID=A0A815KZ48_9BILA|nr:unnamed protein product [Rotaria sordida]CAF1624105.1 unnamed protein product [Rotaria sordida]